MMQGSLAERLRVLRAQRGLTLVEAADKTGIGRDTLSDLERGRRHPVMPTLAKIARGYNVPVEELLEEPVPLVEASGEGPGRATTEETTEARNTADAQLLRSLSRPVLSQMEYNVEALEDLGQAGAVGRSAYLLSWSILRGTLVGLDEVGSILEEEGVDWTNRRNRKILRAYDEVQIAFIALDKAHQSIVDKYSEIVAEDSEKLEQLRRDEEAEKRRFRERRTTTFLRVA